MNGRAPATFFKKKDLWLHAHATLHHRQVLALLAKLPKAGHVKIAGEQKDAYEA
jgi:hypothetical protein